MLTFTGESMLEIIRSLQDALQQLKEGESLSFRVLDPDVAPGSYAGEVIEVDNRHYLYRGYKSWIDLAQQLFCRFGTPLCAEAPLVTLRFTKLRQDNSFHRQSERSREKYGSGSLFARIDKNEESAFAYYYLQALKNVGIERCRSILNLGVNDGSEFAMIQKLLGKPRFETLELCGIDYSQSAVEIAQKRFANHPRRRFFVADINDLPALPLNPVQLCVSIGTLQSPGIDLQKTLTYVVKNLLTPHGAIILGFPNCRWIDGEMIYGAKAPNYAFSELSLLHKDITFCKRYLQQHRFRVTLTGKDYLFLTATKLR